MHHEPEGGGAALQGLYSFNRSASSAMTSQEGVVSTLTNIAAASSEASSTISGVTRSISRSASSSARCDFRSYL